MREIKFRGKPIGIIGDWFYGDLVRELSTGNMFILDVSHTDKGEARFNQLGLQVIPETVGQYTGLKDKNGVEIYEGDIINFYQVLGQSSLQMPFKGNIIYKNSMFQIEYEKDKTWLLAHAWLIKVIDNIHEV